MRATSVLSEGYLQRPNSHTKRSNLFVSWNDDVEMGSVRGFATATDVTICDSKTEPVVVPFERKSLPPHHHRTEVDFIANDELTWESWYNDLKDSFWQAFGSTSRFQLMLELTKTDAMSRKGSYVLSFCSVCTVVCVSVVMLTILSSFAIVGLRMAENNYGPVDLIMRTGGFAASAVSLNYTRVAEIVDTALPPAYRQHSYRIDFAGWARKQSMCALPDNTVQSLWYEPTTSAASWNGTRLLCQATCVSRYCTGNVERTELMVLDPDSDPVFSEGEGRPIGKTLKGLPAGSVIVSTSLATSLKLKVGDRVVINSVIDTDLRHVFFKVVDWGGANINALLSVRVGAVIDDDEFPGNNNDYFVLFSPTGFTNLVLDGLSPTVPEASRAAARLARPPEYATRVLFHMPDRERREAYMQSSFRAIRSRVRDWGAPITEKIGANQITMTTPLLSFLSTMQFFSSFVGLIISIIILALSIISAILIYTLLSIGVETKTYELGIHRMIGFNRSHLVLLVFTNTYAFTLPAWLFGLVAGQFGYWIVRAFIVHYAAVPLGLGVSGSAIGWATLAGLGVPFIAALLPIRALISMALPDALDTARGRGTGVVYRIQRGRSRETDVLLFGIGFLGALSGFAMYSFFPTSLITLNYSLMFYILFLVLLGMLGGLVMLATNFERVMETMMRYLFLFWEPAAVRSMVSKSLSAHRRRNQQTTVMYALSVGFLVFITVAFNIEIASLKFSKERSRGTSVMVSFSRASRPHMGFTPFYAQGTTTLADGTSYAYDATPLHPENALGMTSRSSGFFFADYVTLEQDLMAALGSDVVHGMTYRMASPVGGNLFPVSQIRMKTFGLKENYGLNLNPVPPNFYDVVSSQFVKVNKYDTAVGRYGLTGGLYAASAAESVVIATTTNRVFALRNFSDQFLFETRVRAFMRGVNNSEAVLTGPTTRVQLKAGRAVAVMDSSPVFLMTKFPNNMGEVLLSLPSALRHTGIPYLSCNVLSVNSIFLRVPSPAHYEAVKSYLRQWLSRKDIGYTLRDMTTAVEDIETVDTIFTVFFVVTQIVIMLICFFSLMSSMTANVLDSSKEIGVLLCLGMSRMQVYRVYVWEAFLLVVSSGTLGLLVGMALAETMLLQSSLFTQLTIPFPFPYVQLCIVFVMGFASALAASISPVMYLLNLPSITHILRRVI